MHIIIALTPWAGTTTFVEHYYMPEVAIEVAKRAGIRIVCGDSIIGLGYNNLYDTVQKEIQLLSALYANDGESGVEGEIVWMLMSVRALDWKKQKQMMGITPF